jgi:hypothetical protein
LSHVERGFVTYVGDDDGLLANALNDAAELLSAERVPALAWKKIQYHWPSHSIETVRNLLAVPLENRLFLCKAKASLRDCARFWTPYFLPVCVQLVREHRRIPPGHAANGEFFGSVTPDVYSGMALASVIDTYLLTTRPLTVNGASGRSNGSSADLYYQAKQEEQAKQKESEIGRFLEENDLPLHPRMPAVIVGSVIAAVLEALLQANDRCFDGGLPIDVAEGFQRIMREIAPQLPQRYEGAVAVLREIGAKTGMEGAVEAAIRRYPNRPMVQNGPAFGIGPDESLLVDAARFGVEDVARAADVASAILGPYVRPAQTRPYRHSAKYASRGLRLMRSRLGSWCWIDDDTTRGTDDVWPERSGGWRRSSSIPARIARSGTARRFSRLRVFPDAGRGAETDGRFVSVPATVPVHEFGALFLSTLGRATDPFGSTVDASTSPHNGIGDDAQRLLPVAYIDYRALRVRVEGMSTVAGDLLSCHCGTRGPLALLSARRRTRGPRPLRRHARSRGTRRPRVSSRACLRLEESVFRGSSDGTRCVQRASRTCCRDDSTVFCGADTARVLRRDGRR